MHGLSGRWYWRAPNGTPVSYCLRQASPVRIEGEMYVGDQQPDGVAVTGAVAPSGAIFLLSDGGKKQGTMVLAHRKADTLFVDWTGAPGSGSGIPVDQYGAGLMLRTPSPAESRP